jgi:molecular chaperone DnaJ
MDLYELLGVSRAASVAEIERAYRRLVRRYHPGVNPGDRLAAEMYRQVEHAFTVLGDADRRRDYDKGRSRGGVTTPEAPVAFVGFDFSAPAEGPLAATFGELFADVFQEAAREATAPSRGGDLEIELVVAFRDAVCGGAFPISILRQDRCTSCGGDGRVPRQPAACPACGGDGQRRWARGHMVFSRGCDVCGGAGRLMTQACRACAGAGLHARSEVVTVLVPSGSRSEDRIAVPGRGHAGARGGPAGDLYVTLNVSAHAHFTRAGRDLLLTLPVAVDEAALGARIDVPTLDDPVRLRLPPGTPSGRRFRIRGGGVPAPAGVDTESAGDLIVEVRIVLPPVRDERSKALLREFGERNRVVVRAHLFG